MTDLKSVAFGRGGSSPPSRTKQSLFRLAAIPPGLGPGFRRFESYRFYQLCLGSLIVEHRSYKAKTAEHYRNEVPDFGIDV